MDAPFESLVGWSGPLLAGAFVTIKLVILAYAVALVIGLLGASASLGGGRIVRTVVTMYSIVIRAVPELLLIIILYFAGQDLLNLLLSYLGWGTTVQFNSFTIAVVVLAVVEGAYLMEIFRGAIQAIPKGHIEAADAYGMSPWLRFRRIIVPEMLPTALPSMYNVWLLLVKDSALVSVLGMQELFLTTQQAAASTGAFFLFYGAAGALYLLMTMSSDIVFRWLERRFGHGRPSAGTT